MHRQLETCLASLPGSQAQSLNNLGNKPVEDELLFHKMSAGISGEGVSEMPSPAFYAHYAAAAVVVEVAEKGEEEVGAALAGRVGKGQTAVTAIFAQCAESEMQALAVSFAGLVDAVQPGRDSGNHRSPREIAQVQGCIQGRRNEYVRDSLQADGVAGAERFSHHKRGLQSLHPRVNLAAGHIRVEGISAHHDPRRGGGVFAKVLIQNGRDATVTSASHPVDIEYYKFFSVHQSYRILNISNMKIISCFRLLI